MTETIKAWQCIGCGRIEGPQNCIGVCRDRKVEFVYAAELVEAQERLTRAIEDAAALRAFLRRLSGTTPRDGRWEASYRSMQEHAKALLAHRPEEFAVVAAASPDDGAAPEAATRTREA
ncbi:hypothetical protein BURK1_01950 [Burkholderiales bacterium]|nr:hypothetical protein BURK1_01950 [Burkholderiales bacterium]